jgi:hypothetical protein
MVTKLYKENLKSGQAFERFVETQLTRFGIILRPCTTYREQIEVGENYFGLEIKNDTKMHDTGNLYIELAEKADDTQTHWVPSGIYRQDNSRYYGVGNTREFIVFRKPVLQALHQSEGYHVTSNPTSQGFLLPLHDARCRCLRRFTEMSDGNWMRHGPMVLQATLATLWDTPRTPP